MSLAEREMRAYLRDFIRSCEQVLREHGGIRGDMRATKVKVALLRAYLLVNGDTEAMKPADPGQRDHLLRQVLTVRKSVLALLEMIEPRMPEAVVLGMRLGRTVTETPPEDGAMRSIQIMAWYAAATATLLLSGLAALN